MYGQVYRKSGLFPQVATATRPCQFCICPSCTQLLQREMMSLSCLLVMNREVQLKRHLGNALNVGLTPNQPLELIIRGTWYRGAPAGIQALSFCKEVFEERSIDFTPARGDDLP